MKYFFQVLLFGGLFIYGSIISSDTLYAANDQGGVTVSPAFQEITLSQKDRRVDFSVSLTNETTAPITLSLSLYDFGSLDESGGVAFLGASNDLAKKYSLASWMHPEKDTLAIASGETTNVSVTIENSDSLSPGGHYGALMFRVVDDTTGGASTVSVKQMFSTLVFIKKIGGEVYDLTLSGEEYSSHLFQFQDRLSLQFQNRGNVHLVPRGLVVVRDPLGRVTAKGIINEESAIVLPETIRNYPLRLINQAWSFIPGAYTLETAYHFDGKDDFTTSVVKFDFIPLPATLGFLAFVATCGWYVAKRRRKLSEQKALSSLEKTKHTDV